MKFISPIVLVSAASLWIGHRRWHRSNSVASLKSQLLLLGGSGGDKDPSNKAAALEQEEERSSKISPQSWEDVPKPVQRYLHRVFSQQEKNLLLPSFSETHFSALPEIRSVRSVEFKQKGYMFMNDNWLPFKANQLVSALPAQPGFVWDASVSLVPDDGYLAWLLCWARMDVVDAWTLGLGGRLTAHLFGVFL
ncbi:hypothetical protein MHU86_6231 [Fragilaria crotonensis]|nr:hypothetical protein MHU86_6231 [Fragilaria crotonensis]